MLAYRKITPGPGLALEDAPPPRRPGPHEVAVRVEAVGICGSDVHVLDWSGGYDFMIPHLPVTLGHEFAGVVTEVGPEVTRARAGDRVTVWPSSPCGRCAACARGDGQNCENKRTLGLYADGAFAAHVVVREGGLFPLADHVDFEVAALTEPLCVGRRAVEVGEVKAGDRVVVLGPGTIGQAIAVAARDKGAAVAIAGFNDALRLDVCRRLGFEATCDFAAEGAHAAFLRAEAGADVVLEASGQAVSVADGLALLRKEGVLVLTGIHHETITFEPVDFVRRKLQIRASHGSRPEDWAAVVRRIADDPEALRPMITHREPLANIAQAFARAKNKEANKVMIFPQDEAPR
ncbi:sorbitol dehydrogenase [Acuticoccus sediminis]|uniref:Sorbitol dehydrogenase n=1 Tax=Acuticoccus sediminis TaxID=2184697 RepID=A0A8B2NP17_9HYPH|nr:alcohol dehydrogenase catalytic domain-containing protein [Acuticoccus sediminis]RAH97402.1 sorbitol dehydrogenase [Acuticoccus sediminis]